MTRRCSICGRPEDDHPMRHMMFTSIEGGSDKVLEYMAEHMLDPLLIKVDKTSGTPVVMSTLPSGNTVRLRVLKRALEAAKEMGWHLVRVE